MKFVGTKRHLALLAVPFVCLGMILGVGVSAMNAEPADCAALVGVTDESLSLGDDVFVTASRAISGSIDDDIDALQREVDRMGEISASYDRLNRIYSAAVDACDVGAYVE